MIGLFHFEAVDEADRRLSGERQILTNRLIMGFAATMACLLLGTSAYISLSFAIYLSCNALLMLGRRTSMKPQYRWLAAILLDAVMAMVVQLYEPEMLSFAYIIMLWAIIGNGFRYGNQWLFVAAFAKFVSFSIVIAWSPFWQSMPVLAGALLVGLLALPIYCSRLIANLSYATEQAETANRAKTYFLASVSHELRTPLNAIIGYATQLEEENLSPRVAGMVHSSHKAAEHLLYLIDQLLHASRRESMDTPLEEEAFQLPDLLAETREMLLPQALDRGIAFHCHAHPGSDAPLIGAVGMLRNIMVNLASNAIKFTDEGSVVIECGVDLVPAGAELWFAVEDSGVGIPFESQQRIFEPFTQADDSVLDRFGGTGLGLAICRQFAEQLGGRLEVESALGTGSRFTYRGPVRLDGQDLSEDETPLAIIGFGPEPLPAEGADAAHARIDWCVCDDFAVFDAAVDLATLEAYDIAVIDEAILAGIDAEHPVWARFTQARTPSVLRRSGTDIDLHDIRLRAAFATVIPHHPDFAALRSAARIGSSFRNADVPANTAGLDADEANRTVPRRILVADDNRTNREVLKTILESAGHEVHYAVDGEEALRALEELTLDIVFLDVNMPKLSGVEVCAMWRQMEGRHDHLPIVGLTADATDETMKRCLDAGMDARFTKPMRRAELVAAVEQYCPGPSELPAALPTDPLGKLVPIAPAATPTPAAETPSVLDQEQIDNLLEMGGEEFLLSLCESYSEDVDKLLVDLGRSVQDKDLEAFRFSAHAIKSSAANIGATQLFTLCGHLELISAPEFSARGGELAARADTQARLVKDELCAVTKGSRAA